MRFFKIARKKLTSKSGFTLVEMLVSLAIVVMMSLMISVGTSVGAKVQRESTFVAESDILASTINTAVQDVLRFSEIEAYSPKTDDELEAMGLTGTAKSLESTKSALVGDNLLTIDDIANSCLITNDDYGITSGALIMDNSHDSKDRLAMRFQEYEKAVSGGGRTPIEYSKLKPHFLVSHGVYTTLIVEDFEIDYAGATLEDGVYKGGVFTMKYTIKEPGSKPLTKKVETSFRLANDEAPTTAAPTTPTVPTT